MLPFLIIKEYYSFSQTIQFQTKYLMSVLLHNFIDDNNNWKEITDAVTKYNEVLQYFSKTV